MIKLKLISYYKMLFNTYYYNINYDEEKSKRYAYYAIRNIIGVIIFMLYVITFVIITCIYNINIDLKANRPLGYLFMIVIGFSYFSISKKYLKPLFDDVKLEKEKASKKFYIISIIGAGLFGGALYTIPRLLNIYLCG